MILFFVINYSSLLNIYMYYLFIKILLINEILQNFVEINYGMIIMV